MSVALLQNIPLPSAATGGMTSTVGEPSLANHDQTVLFSGNWYAAESANHGGAWSLRNPFTTFPKVNGGFCCDQTIIYDRSRDVLVWLLQYVKLAGTNTLRVAVRHGANPWHWWDFSPTMLNPAWTDRWLDYNSAALSSNFLYVTSNMFDFSPQPVWQRAVVIRLKLDDLAAGAGLPFDLFDTTQNGSLRCTLGATSTMYFGSHNGTQTVRLFTWPESSTTVTRQDIPVAPWNRGIFTAVCPDGRDWLGRCDDRITAAWTGQGVIGFAWSANRDASRPFPYVRVVRLNEATKAIVDQPDIWSPDFAYVYPDVAPNGTGNAGITLFRGGGQIFPSHVVGIFNQATTRWELQGTKNGTDAPADGKWGDYLTCRPHDAHPDEWIAAGYTLQNGGDRTNIEPRFVVFSRAAAQRRRPSLPPS